MILEQALFNYLSTYAGLVALVSTRLYPLQLPQGGAFPAVTYAKVSNARIRGFNTNIGGRPRFQVSCWGKTYADAKAVAGQVRAALDGYDGTMGGVGGVVVRASYMDNETDLLDPDTGLYHVACDFIIWHEGQ